MFCLRVCLCTTCMSGAHGGLERASDPLGLELQVVMSTERAATTLNPETFPQPPK